MQSVAQAWLVYRLTESSFMLGLTQFITLLPVSIFGLYGGVMADRYSQRTLLIIVHFVAMIQAIILATLTLTGTIKVWHILVLAFLLGFTHAFEIPARHALLGKLVPKNMLHNAVALVSSAFNTARFIGPAIAGWLILAINEGIVFLINAITFGFYIIMMWFVSKEATARQAREGVSKLKEALQYAWRETHIRSGLMLLAIISLFGLSFSVLMPIFASEIFGGGPATLGNLLSAAGAGALVAALNLAQRQSTHQIGRLIGATGLIAGTAMIVFSQTNQFWAALPLMLVSGFCLTSTVASTNTLIQSIVPDHLRGRVMSLFAVTVIGMAPFGSLLAGIGGEYLGVETTVMLYGVIVATAAAYYLWRAPRYDSDDGSVAV